MLRLGKFFYVASGPQTAPKVWSGTTVTASGGTWSVSYANAGFAVAPVISVLAISSGATAATQYEANPTAPTATGVSGTANAGVNAIVVGGATTAAAPAGVAIHVIAIGA